MMSTSIYAVAQKKITEGDFEKVTLFNSLCDHGYSLPSDLEDDLRTMLGSEALEDDRVRVPGNMLVELPIECKGDPRYDNGMIISIGNLPLNTVAIRIYSE